MSGTSLDGLDLADCTISVNNGSWDFVLNHGITISYSKEILELLKLGVNLTDEQIEDLDRKLAELFAEACLTLDLAPTDCIASHGHTIKHRPDLGYTLQIGNPKIIAKQTGKMSSHRLFARLPHRFWHT